jgi:hypothetical protein
MLIPTLFRCRADNGTRNLGASVATHALGRLREWAGPAEISPLKWDPLFVGVRDEARETPGEGGAKFVRVRDLKA